MRLRVAAGGLALALASGVQALELGEVRHSGAEGGPAIIDIGPLHGVSPRTLRASFDPEGHPAGLSIDIDRTDAGPQLRIAGVPSEALAGLGIGVELHWPGGRLERAYRWVDGADGPALQPAGVSRFGPTQPGSTLYSIAEALRPPAVTINQMMLALLSANPRAFNAPNVNALQRRVMLDVPAPQALRYPDPRQATAAVRRQLAVWAGRGVDEPPQTLMLSVPPLQLLPVESGISPDDIAALGDRLEATGERLEASNQRLAADNRRLRDTVSALRDDIERLGVQLDELPALESVEPAVASTAAEGRSADALTAADVQAWAAVELERLAADPAAGLQRPFGRWVAIALGVILLTLLLVILLARRARSARKTPPEALPDHWRSAGRPVTTPDVESDNVNELIAAGRLEGAQALLDEALGEAPDAIELRCRLLDVLAMRGDRAGFVAEAHVLHAQLGDAADSRWQRVVRQGQELAPDHPLFGNA